MATRSTTPPKLTGMVAMGVLGLPNPARIPRGEPRLTSRKALRPTSLRRWSCTMAHTKNGSTSSLRAGSVPQSRRWYSAEVLASLPYGTPPRSSSSSSETIDTTSFRRSYTRHGGVNKGRRARKSTGCRRCTTPAACAAQTTGSDELRKGVGAECRHHRVGPKHLTWRQNRVGKRYQWAFHNARMFLISCRKTGTRRLIETTKTQVLPATGRAAACTPTGACPTPEAPLR